MPVLAQHRSQNVWVNYSFRNVKEFLPQGLPLIRDPGKQQTLLYLYSPLWTAAFPHNSEQQNLLTTQHLFPRPNIYTHTREINSKNCIYQYCLEKPATTAHFGVGKVLILPVLLSILSVLTQRNDKDKYPVAHPVCLPTTALLFGQRRVCHQAHC